MVNYLTDDHWNHFVPEPLRLELHTAKDVNQAIDTLFWRSTRDSQQFPAIASFLTVGQRQRLQSCKNLLTTVEQLEQQLPSVTHSQLSIKEFMSAKKCHEVGLIKQVKYIVKII